MSYCITVFDHIKDVDTSKSIEVSTFDQLADILFESAKEPAIKPEKGVDYDPSHARLISSARYREGTTRKNMNVSEWSRWCAMDVDDYEGGLDALIQALEGYNYVCYSTGSSTEEHPKFRLVFDLTDPVSANRIKHFWYALNKEIMDVGDAQTKDLSRMFYVPAQYPDAFNFIFRNEGSPINPMELMMKHEYQEPSLSLGDALPESMRKKLVQFRSEKLTNKDFKWTSYEDCPFVNKDLVTEYKSITLTGWYHTMYRIMVSIAARATLMGYPIAAYEISELCKELDRDTGGWYTGRPIELEAERALQYVIMKGTL